MIKVSVVVPVYKVEKYLNRCVESITNQTLKDIEIILVDDGSPDLCPVMCDEWSKRDSRIRVVHKKNGGLSSARNAGLKIAHGEYVGFVDSDDTIEEQMFEKMYNCAKKNNVDFVMSDYNRIDKTLKTRHTLAIEGGHYSPKKINKIIFPSLIMSNELEYGPLLSVWVCLYRTNFLKDNNIIFDEEVKWSEDNLFSSIVGYNANSFYYLKGEYFYNYYKNESSITTSYLKNAWNVYKIMNKKLVEYFHDKKNGYFLKQLDFHLMYYACNCINKVCIAKDKKDAKKEVDYILNDKDLETALNSRQYLNVSKKLLIQLLLMKYKCSSIIVFIKKR